MRLTTEWPLFRDAQRRSRSYGYARFKGEIAEELVPREVPTLSATIDVNLEVIGLSNESARSKLKHNGRRAHNV